jgi:hypothetical protein
MSQSATPPEWHFPAFRETEPGVWESVAVLGASPEKDGETLFSVLYLLGFGAYL